MRSRPGEALLGARTKRPASVLLKTRGFVPLGLGLRMAERSDV